MTYLNGLSSEEKEEIRRDRCDAYQSGIMGLVEFSAELARLGYNATDIADMEKFYRPSPPENEED
jgi:hypothetical protein